MIAEPRTEDMDKPAAAWLRSVAGRTIDGRGCKPIPPKRVPAT